MRKLRIRAAWGSLFVLAGLLVCVCGGAQAQNISLRAIAEYVVNNRSVAHGILEYAPGEFQFFAMKPYTGSAKLAGNGASITTAFMVQTFRGTDPKRNPEEMTKFKLPLVIRGFMQDQRQQLSVLSKSDNRFHPVADVVGGRVRDSYLDKFKWEYKYVPIQDPKDFVGYAELTISAWPPDDPCFGL